MKIDVQSCTVCPDVSTQRGIQERAKPDLPLSPPQPHSGNIAGVVVRNITTINLAHSMAQ